MSDNKILIISDCPSDPPTAGNRNCIKQYCSLLKNMGLELYFLYIISPNTTQSEIKEMQKIWGNFLYFHKTSYLQYFLQKAIAKIARILNIDYPLLDIFCPWFITKEVKRITEKNQISNIIINYIWLSKIFIKSNIKIKAVFTHDVFTYKRLKGKSLWYTFSPNKESKALLRATHILAIQNNEAIYYNYLAPNKKVYTVYMPFTYTEQPLCKNNFSLLFFSGGNEHNINGLMHFIKEIYPEIKKCIPKINLVIGGSICQKLKDIPFDSSVSLKGCFEDPSEFYKMGNIVINPVFEGTGLKVKTFEALSYGKITLVHPHSTEGIFDQEQAPLFKCITAHDYINNLNNLLYNYQQMEMIKQSCKQYIYNLNTYIKHQYLNCFNL